MTDIPTDIPPEGFLRLLTDGEVIRMVFPAETQVVLLRLDQARSLATTILHFLDIVEAAPNLLEGRVDFPNCGNENG